MIFLDPLKNVKFVSYHHKKIHCDAFGHPCPAHFWVRLGHFWVQICCFWFWFNGKIEPKPKTTKSCRNGMELPSIRIVWILGSVVVVWPWLLAWLEAKLLPLTPSQLHSPLFPHLSLPSSTHNLYQPISEGVVVRGHSLFNISRSIKLLEQIKTQIMSKWICRILDSIHRNELWIGPVRSTVCYKVMN